METKGKISQKTGDFMKGQPYIFIDFHKTTIQKSNLDNSTAKRDRLAFAKMG